MRYVLNSKLVGERITVQFNFLESLTIPETLVGHAVEVAVDVGLDPEPELLLFGAGEHTALLGEVSQQIQLGIPGVIYWLICTVQTDLGNTYIMKSRLAILPSPMLVPDILSEIYTTELYPIECTEQLTNAHEIRQVRLNPQPFPFDYIQQHMQLGSGQLYGGAKSFTAPPESIQHSLDWSDGVMEVLVIPTSTEEYLQHSMDLVSGELDTVVITYTHPSDKIQHSLGFPSGSTLA